MSDIDLHEFAVHFEQQLSGVWRAISPDYGISGYGVTREEARSALHTAIVSLSNPIPVVNAEGVKVGEFKLDSQKHATPLVDDLEKTPTSG